METARRDLISCSRWQAPEKAVYKAADIADVAAIAMATKTAMEIPMHTAAAMASPLAH